METVFSKMLVLWLGNRDEHCALESHTPGLNVKGNLYLYRYLKLIITNLKSSDWLGKLKGA